MEQLSSPQAPSFRHLMHEGNGLPPSTYTSNADFAGGGSLGRQYSIQLTPEQFEKLYLQPANENLLMDPTMRGVDRFSGNPTVLGLAVFLVTLTPLSCYFMGFMGSTSASALTLMGTLYFSAGLGLYVAAIMEWLIGNTFPFVVFASYVGEGFRYAGPSIEEPGGSIGSEGSIYRLGT
ncbi:hypothetical protein QFC22_000446 [Naganishia vaughanmartiniae]|uniref:Uncharacterized protein n=1 Tax=Naganishia vaughanmartiniae TaxID=1424756 RepID=A0ACC2XN47_9TREE|nr:hypothetical protein QFC22_000446 [Naganishia vaughanmartiniae]